MADSPQHSSISLESRLDSDRVLVAIMNNREDFAKACEEHWYRIPVISADKWAGNRWPPDWLAFYQTKVFGEEGYAVNYFSQVLDVREVYRYELFPDRPRDEKSMHRYYQLLLGPIAPLAQPIISKRLRRITFISTTWRKLMAASEINDLFDDSPLEDRLWQEFRRLGINAERQEFVRIKNHHYALDFALYCATGRLNVETDGDLWHSDRKRIAHDNVRSNDLETSGWRLLRFNTTQINEEMDDYCLPTIVENIRNMGGLDTVDGVVKSL